MGRMALDGFIEELRGAGLRIGGNQKNFGLG
jgi:hypothetical protein